MPTFPSFDTTEFSYSQWGETDTPSAIVLCIHGFCGAACDFNGFANTLTAKLPKSSIVAYNLRGMGLDPVAGRVGDIESANYWTRDLLSFCHHMRTLHPLVPLFWCAESLGALIACNTLSSSPQARSLCAGLILYSPVVTINKQVARWKIAIARVAAQLFPQHRLSLQIFTGDQPVKVTQGADDHSAQSMTNPWHVNSFSMRLLHSIAGLIDSMPDAAKAIDIPTLVVNGGRDFFTHPDDLAAWLNFFPGDTSVDHAYFKDSYHLMLYDAQAPVIFARTIDWLILRRL